MSTRAAQYTADVLRREQLSSHFVRLVLGGPGLADFTSTGVPDEWVALTAPGQFQIRYYTVRSFRDGELTLDVVVHDHGLVTEWAAGDCVGDTVTVSEPKASFAMPPGAQWLLLVGDLTALPAMARIIESTAGHPGPGLGGGPRRGAARLRRRRRRRHLAGAARRARSRPPRTSSAPSTGRRVRDTSGWRGSPPRCGRSAST